MIKLKVQELYMGYVKQVSYAGEFSEEKKRMDFSPWYSKHQGFLPWYWPMVMSMTKNIDPIKEYHQHNYGFDPRY